MERAGMGAARAAELLSRLKPQLGEATADYCRAAVQEAARSKPNDDKRRLGLLAWMIGGPGRVSVPRRRDPDSGARAAAEKQERIDLAAAVATDRQRAASTIADLHATGRLPALLAAAIDGAGNDFIRSTWRKHLDNPDPAAIAANRMLAPKIIELAGSPPPTTPGPAL